MTQRWGSLLIVLLAVVVAANFWWLAKHVGPGARYWVWVITTGALTLGALIVGKSISGYWTGIIIDNRNRMSLSKLQMAIWTLVLLPALITGAASNVAGIGAEFITGGPLEIGIPNELLAVMGIAGATLAASPVILKTKTTSAADPATLAATQARLNLRPDQSGSDGKVFIKTFRQTASWRDLFLGDEVGNADTADLGKIQQFFITVLLAAIYLAAIGSMFEDDGAIQSLPKLSEKFVWLLAVSHATYLAYKAAPHTKDASKACDSFSQGPSATDPPVKSAG
jgi:hypothetical protein